MTHTKLILSLCSLMALGLNSCTRDNPNTGEKTYIVISDIHLGDQRSIDDGYGWNITMKDTLSAFLDYIKDNKFCDELVLAGDIVDEWVAPPSYLTFADKSGKILSESEFFSGVMNTNKKLMEKFYSLKSSGVKLVYVPGNHDMQATSQDFDLTLPGLFQQARSKGVEGMGEYRPDKDIFIEHGHRYDIMNAPYIGKNGVDSINGSILPPGFFVSRINCGSRMRGNSGSLTDSGSSLDDISYNLGWTVMGQMFGQDSVVTMTDGMTKTYGFDEYAYNTSKLYNGIDDYEEKNDGWISRCRRNKAFFVPTVTTSLIASVLFDFCDLMGLDVLATPGMDSRILVWGHSHEPKFIKTENAEGVPCVYVNTGCWVDGKIAGSENTAYFCKIERHSNGTYNVSLCHFFIDQKGQKTVETIDELSLDAR